MTNLHPLFKFLYMRIPSIHNMLMDLHTVWDIFVTELWAEH